MVSEFQILSIQIHVLAILNLRSSLGRKLVQKSFFKLPFGALSKIGDQIRKYVVKDHGFPFIKWCDTPQLAQRFGNNKHKLVNLSKNSAFFHTKHVVVGGLYEYVKPI